MPDMTGHRDRVKDFKHNGPLATTSRKLKGGVFLTRNRRSYIVNIRPSTWNDKNLPSQFWIGKIETRKWAQYCADTIYHYTGRPLFHFKSANLIFPLLECNGTEMLTTSEMRSKYVKSIAGEGFTSQREAFITKVLDVMNRTDFHLQGQRLLNPSEEAAAPSVEAAAPSEEAAAPREEAAAPVEEAAAPREGAAPSVEEAASLGEEAVVPVEEIVRSKDDDDRAEDTPPMEFDSMSLQAIRQIQLSSVPLFSDVIESVYPTRVLHIAGSDTNLVCGSDFSQAFAPSFEIYLVDSGNSLRSVGQSLGSTCYTLDDCPNTCYEDKEEHRSWMDAITELNTNAYRSRMEVLCNDEPELDPVFDSTAYLSWIEDPDFVSTTTHMTAEAEQLKNAKRQRIVN